MVFYTADDPGDLGLRGTVALTLMVLALIAIAVGDELAIAHPSEDATLGFTILTFSGPAMFLLAQVFFLHAALGHTPRSRPIGLAAHVILAVATAPRTHNLGLAAASAGQVADTVRKSDDPNTRRPRVHGTEETATG